MLRAFEAAAGLDEGTKKRRVGAIESRGFERLKKGQEVESYQRMLPGPYGSWKYSEVAAESKKLLAYAAKLHPDGKKWAGGFIYRISTATKPDKSPVWEEGRAEWSRPFVTPLEKAQREIASAIRLYMSGWQPASYDKWSKAKRGQYNKGIGKGARFRQHFYRIWIVGVTAAVLSKYGGFDPFKSLSRKGDVGA